jgi:hypothetical protein
LLKIAENRDHNLDPMSRHPVWSDPFFAKWAKLPNLTWTNLILPNIWSHIGQIDQSYGSNLTESASIEAWFFEHDHSWIWRRFPTNKPRYEVCTWVRSFMSRYDIVPANETVLLSFYELGMTFLTQVR